MATDRQPRNPYIVCLAVVGGIAGAIALTLAWIADSLTRGAASLDPYSGLPDPAVIASLFAGADRFGFVAIVTIVGALVVAGFRWMPTAPATNAPQLRLDGTLYPPGGLTDAERRLLDGDDSR